MNYYNPYFYTIPMSVARPSLLASLRGALGGGRLTLGSVINGTQRTLGIVNQAIPIIKQVTPAIKNAKTMFRVMNEFKKVDTLSSDLNKGSVKSGSYEDLENNFDQNLNSNSSGPTFFA